MTICYISGLSHTAKSTLPIEQLAQYGVAEREVSSLRDNGLRRFCQDKRPPSEIFLEAISETLRACDRAAKDIDAVIMAGSTFNWSEEKELSVWRVLHDAGLTHAKLIGLWHQESAAAGAALQVATALVDGNQVRTVLIVLSCQVEDTARLSRRGGVLFSDGVACCLVSAAKVGDFEILASDSVSNAVCGMTPKAQKQSREVMGHTMRMLTTLVDALYRQADKTPRDISHLFCTNGSLDFFATLAACAQVDDEIVHTADLARHAHLGSADSFASLCNAVADGALQAGDLVMVINWAESVCSGSLLRRV